MGWTVKGCQEGGELTTDPRIVCGHLVRHMCAIGVFEGVKSALKRAVRFSWQTLRLYTH
ncbi:hypothetical protein JG687_00005831 [Phytophthora cactorum]|uniref:Uncharacterized protein n=1 Tax=Phytophthora cactorum TaxID=29920 RepID=A0A8T1UPJ9_9STRA|nr:hypothetical protein JG687_00005831 [Phytophthora cactorum]